MKIFFLMLILPLALGFKFNIPLPKLLHFEALILPHKPGCILESKIVENLGLNALLNKEFPDDDDNFKCFIKCLSRSIGIYNEMEKKFDQQMVLKKLQVDKAVVDECYGSSEDPSTCNASFTASKCILRNLEVKGGLLPNIGIGGLL